MVALGCCGNQLAAESPQRICSRATTCSATSVCSLAQPVAVRMVGTPLTTASRNIHGYGLSHQRKVITAAAPAAPPAPDVVYHKEYPLSRDHTLSVSVSEEDGAQVVRLETELPGKVLLHWGVQRSDNDSWALPEEGSRPAGSVVYKSRALQTPWRSKRGYAFEPEALNRREGETARLEVRLQQGQTADYLNFVVKESSSNRWYDSHGSNFHVPLRLALSSMAEVTIDEEVFIPDAQLPELPSNLCGIWSYIQWEHQGCPGRSDQDSDRAYHHAIEDLKDYLRKGKSLDELWAVANGHVKYNDFLNQAQGGNGNGKSKSNGKTVPRVPEELVGVQSYLLWEQAGRPNGADFSQDARHKLEKQLRAGKTVEDLERALRAPSAEKPPRQDEQPQQQHQPEQQDQPQQQQDQPKQQEVQLGESIGADMRNPLSMIKKPPQLSQAKREAPARALKGLEDAAAAAQDCIWQRSFAMGDQQEMLITVRQPEGQDSKLVQVVSDCSTPLVLHWGARTGGQGEWLLPSEKLWPAGTSKATDIAAETACKVDDSLKASIKGSNVAIQALEISVPADLGVRGLIFVIRSEDGSRWWRDGGGNFNVPIPGAKGKAEGGASFEDELSRQIVAAEASSAWTLMHRFNKAADLLAQLKDGAHDNPTDAAARIFVWLRYSSARKLTWQRNYNTQPRILGEAQARLTQVIGEAHGQLGGEAQEWVRACLGCVGRGSNAQAVRDEILNIMHRNHIGEKRGTWMEDWHQKLHNNTTPDDVPICEAFIAFLEAKGDNGTYWRILSDAGITRERLESFDRPIKVEPEDYPDKRDALVGDFRNYLSILKSVHSGADLAASAQAVGDRVPGSIRGHLGYVLSHQRDHNILPLIENAVEARTELAPTLAGNRDLLYLDLALENVVRSAAERGTGAAGRGASSLVGPLLQNLVLSTGDNEELCYCLKAWQDLPGPARGGQYPSKETALKAAAVVDRIRRAVATTADAQNSRLMPIAVPFGKSFGVEDWYTELFAEEVVRGGPGFALSLVLSAIEPTLRAAAELGAWQLISPVNALGRVVVVNGLHEVQDDVYDEPTVLLAKRVTGEEEVPEGAVAVLTPDAPDVLSHVSVRARNMKVLFAICHELEPLKEIEGVAGKVIELKVSAAGGVTWEAADEAQLSSAGGDSKQPKKVMQVAVPKWCGKWAVGMDAFQDGVVGAKSKNIAGLRGKLPDSIKLPPSVTVPFGAFEEALGSKDNTDVKERLEAAIKDIPQAHAVEQLQKCHDIAMEIKTPQKLEEELKAAMKAGGIPAPDTAERWEQAMKALKGVWASKFNERAMLSMRKVGLDFRDLRMAVVVQRVVPAAYAFVIHTHNPTNNSAEEVFAEVVLGLGESIVSGLVPGSALSFKAPKSSLDKPQVIAYPSKGDGMFVCESLIFRSDSNGEDLEGYAGAGLYDSITLDTTETRKVDYGADRLLSDEGFRTQLLSNIAKTGASVEEALGSAQDVEGCVEADGSITVVQTRPQM